MKTTYAGFQYPKVYSLVASPCRGTTLEARRRAVDRTYTGPYYRTSPSPQTGTVTPGASFYLGSDWAPSLRWQWCDDVTDAHIDHTGWWADDYGDGDKIRGVVFRLPHARGFLAGWSMGEGMASEVEYYIYDTETGAARAADSWAERVAEDEREHQASMEGDEDE
jgi:hypothetical protein